MKPTVSIRKALADKALLGNILDGPSWHAWRTLMIAAMGEPLTDTEHILFTAHCAGLAAAPADYDS